MPVNAENILKVADAIEHHSIPDLGFNMADFHRKNYGGDDLSGHKCGTVACIGGWANAVRLGLDAAPTSFMTLWNVDEASLFLGLGYDAERALFFPNSAHLPDDLSYHNITPAKAVAVLRHLAATGEVSWEV